MANPEKSANVSENARIPKMEAEPRKSTELMDVGQYTDNDFLMSLIIKHNKKGKGLPIPCKTEPPKKSAVLDRVKAFLPIMKAEQVQLEQQVKQCQDTVNIEHIDDEEDQHIEMDIQLYEEDSSSSGSSEDSSSSDEDDSDGKEDCQCSKSGTLPGEVTESNIQIHQKRCRKHRPKIEIIPDESDSDPEAVQIIEPALPDVISIEDDTAE